MNLSFLRYFKKDKAAAGGVAVAPRPVTPLDKPASERFGKTVMPNVSRIVGLDPLRDFPMTVPVGNPPPVAPPSVRKISLGGNGAVVVAPETDAAPAAERTIALQLADLVPHLPAGLLQTTPIDSEQRILFKASELERGMATGRPTVLLRSIFQQAPDFFLGDVDATDKREVVLPFGKVLEQFTALQVRPDQLAEKSVPQVETPFLKMTIEDGQRFGTSVSPVPAATPSILPSSEPEPVPAPVAAAPIKLEKAPATPPLPVPAAPVRLEIPASPPEAAAVSPQPIRPIRLSVPNEAGTSAAEAPAPAPIRLGSSPARPPLAPKKISPNGTGVSATERVPASSGPPVPTPLPSPFAPPSPARIPFRVSPPSNDLREPVTSGPVRKPAAVAFSVDGPRVRLPLRNVLRGISPFQLSGPIGDVPETATIEIPFSIIEPQLSLGRIAISPAQFQAALPEEYRSLLKIEETELPVVLPLEEVLQNLPNESLQLRGDQEEIEIAEVFETPFSTKAAEDAARMKVSTGPIAKPVPPTENAVVAGGGDPGQASIANATSESISTQPGSPPPATTRTALQVAFDTDDTLDAKSIVAHASRLTGVSACAIVFSDGLSLAGNIPAEYEAEALCALAPSIMKRINDQMIGANLGPLNGITLYCAKTPVSFFAHGNICLTALHSAGALAAEIRARLSCVVRELARLYAQPA
jgi:predicted regulator of Ras-like GTPase activity (Roadblock/LC7/MglB family)